MEDIGRIDNQLNISEEQDAHVAHLILNVLAVDLCARAILDYVPVKELVRSERVCRQWQRAVRDYLHSCRTLSLEVFQKSRRRKPPYSREHRTIKILFYNYNLPLIFKTLDKLGPCMREVIIRDFSENEDLSIIASKCPNVQTIDITFSDNDEHLLPSLCTIKYFKHLRQIALNYGNCYIKRDDSDQAHGIQLKESNCENIWIGQSRDLTGSFLKHLKHNTLKTLRLNTCSSLNVSHLLSAVHNLRTVTRLDLEHYDLTLADLHLLLMEMIQLEELSLAYIRSTYSTSFGTELSKSISQLVNLKHLDLFSSNLVDDLLLEALAQGCKKLEYLDIRYSWSKISARGVSALYCRAPAAVTSLYFDGGYTDRSLGTVFGKFQRLPLYQELERLGFVERTLDWFQAACRYPRRMMLPIQINSEGAAARNETPQPELIIIVNLNSRLSNTHICMNKCFNRNVIRR